MSQGHIIGANCPETSGTVPKLEALSRVVRGTCFNWLKYPEILSD